MGARGHRVAREAPGRPGSELHRAVNCKAAWLAGCNWCPLLVRLAYAMPCLVTSLAAKAVSELILNSGLVATRLARRAHTSRQRREDQHRIAVMPMSCRLCC